MQAAPVSAWQMKLGIRRELGLYADSIANYGASNRHKDATSRPHSYAVLPHGALLHQQISVDP